MPATQEVENQEQRPTVVSPARSPNLPGTKWLPRQYRSPIMAQRASPIPGHMAVRQAGGGGGGLAPPPHHSAYRSTAFHAAGNRGMGRHAASGFLPLLPLHDHDEAEEARQRHQHQREICLHFDLNPDTRLDVGTGHWMFNRESHDSVMTSDRMSVDALHLEQSQWSEGSSMPDLVMDSPRTGTTSDFLMSVPGTPGPTGMDLGTGHRFQPVFERDRDAPKEHAVPFDQSQSHPDWWDHADGQRTNFLRATTHDAEFDMDIIDSPFEGVAETQSLPTQVASKPELPAGVPAKPAAVEHIDDDYCMLSGGALSPDYYHEDDFEPEQDDMGAVDDSDSRGPSAASTDGQVAMRSEANGGGGGSSSGSKRMRERGGSENGSWSNDEDIPGNKRSRIDDPEPTDAESATKRLACPYQKFDPLGEPSCGHPKPSNPCGGFKDANRLKAHLLECHDQFGKCERCWSSFRQRNENEQYWMERLQRHMAEKKCRVRPSPRKYWMDDSQKAALKSTQYGTDHERWYRFMHLLISELAGNMSVTAIRVRYEPWYTPPSDQSYPTPSPSDPNSSSTPGSITTPTPVVVGPFSEPSMPMAPQIGPAAREEQPSGLLEYFFDIDGNENMMTQMFTFDGHPPLPQETTEFGTSPAAAAPQPRAEFVASTPRRNASIVEMQQSQTPAGLSPPQPRRTSDETGPQVTHRRLQDLRDQSRRLRDQINQIGNQVSGAQSIVQGLLNGLGGDAREQAQRIAELLEDIQCSIDRNP